MRSTERSRPRRRPAVMTNRGGLAHFLHGLCGGLGADRDSWTAARHCRAYCTVVGRVSSSRTARSEAGVCPLSQATALIEAVLVTLGVIVAFFAGVPVALAAFLGGALLLVARYQGAQGLSGAGLFHFNPVEPPGAGAPLSAEKHSPRRLPPPRGLQFT